MKRTTLLIIASMAVSLGAQAYEDDIYYNPKKDNKQVKTETRNPSTGQYLVDFDTMDVDEYNNRGYYYTTPIDTIGMGIESQPDFVYTTQIQKYYNPTIVTDNYDIVKDVLDNSYGNIEVVYNYNGLPYFSTYAYGWPYYYSGWYNPWSWSVGFGPFSIGWNWGPSWAWNWGWGPSWNWGWGPSWNWGWGPGWAWSPGWGSGWGPGWGWNRPGWGPGPMATYSPGGRRPFGGNVGGFGGGNFAGRPSGGAGNAVAGRPSAGQGTAVGRPTVNRPGAMTSTPHPSTGGVARPSSGTTARPAGTVTTGPTNSTPARPSGTVTTRPSTGVTTRPSGTVTTRPSTGVTAKPSGTVTTRPSGGTTAKPSTNVSRPSSTPSRSTSTPNSSTFSSPSRSSGSYSGGSRSGGFSGGGRSGGFSGGGRRR